MSEETHFGLKKRRLPMKVDTWTWKIERRMVYPPSSLEAICGQAQNVRPYEPSNLHQRNERAHPSDTSSSLSLSLCSRVHSLPLPPKLEISVDLCLDRARIKRNSRVSRTRCFHLVLRRIAIKQNGGLNGRALLLYVHPCVRYVSILP